MQDCGLYSRETLPRTSLQYHRDLGLEYVVTGTIRPEHGSEVTNNFFWFFVGKEVASMFLLALKNHWTKGSTPSSGEEAEFLWTWLLASYAKHKLRRCSQALLANDCCLI